MHLVPAQASRLHQNRAREAGSALVPVIVRHAGSLDCRPTWVWPPVCSAGSQLGVWARFEAFRPAAKRDGLIWAHLGAGTMPFW